MSDEVFDARFNGAYRLVVHILLYGGHGGCGSGSHRGGGRGSYRGSGSGSHRRSGGGCVYLLIEDDIVAGLLARGEASVFRIIIEVVVAFAVYLVVEVGSVVCPCNRRRGWCKIIG